MVRVFEPVAPRAYFTLSWVHEIQRIEIVLQNQLAQDPGAVLSGLVETMQTKLVDYNDFVCFKKSTSILLCLWERANQRLFDQVYPEFTTQLIENQLLAMQELELGQLRDRLLVAIMDGLVKIENGSRLHLMDLMNHIEDVFGELHMIKGSKKNNVVKIMAKGRLTTKLKN